MTFPLAARQRRLPDLRAVLDRDPRRLTAMVAIAFALTSVGLLATPRTTLAWDINSFSSTSEAQLVSLTNQARASAGLRSLRVDSTLTSIARWRSKDMIVRDYFSHTILGTNYNVFHVLDQKGYCYIIAGENIGWNNYPDDVATTTIQRQFMDSPDHRANILGKSWDVIGIGAYKGPTGKKMWTVIFADKCGSTAPKATPKPTPKPTPRPTPRPTAAPHVAATPKPTPAPTPDTTPLLTTSPLSTDDLGLGRGPDGQPNPSSSAGSGDRGNNGNNGNGTPPGLIRDATPGSSESSLRIADPGDPPGLFEAVVSGVTGFFFGN